MNPPRLLFFVLLLSAGVCSSAFSQAKPEVRHVQVGDVSLAYYTKGSGKPLLMINGFAWTAFLEGGHAFLFQSNKQFADLVSAFLQ